MGGQLAPPPPRWKNRMGCHQRTPPLVSMKIPGRGKQSGFLDHIFSYCTTHNGFRHMRQRTICCRNLKVKRRSNSFFLSSSSFLFLFFFLFSPHIFQKAWVSAAVIQHCVRHLHCNKILEMCAAAELYALHCAAPQLKSEEHTEV